MRDSPTDLAAWARRQATAYDQAVTDDNGAASKLRAIADWLDQLDKDRERLTYLDTRGDLLLSFEPGDPDVGVWSAWFADKPTGELINGRPVVKTEAYNGSLRGLIDDLRSPQVVESDLPARPDR